jgi:hypothetical protein
MKFITPPMMRILISISCSTAKYLKPFSFANMYKIPSNAATTSNTRKQVNPLHPRKKKRCINGYSVTVKAITTNRTLKANLYKDALSSGAKPSAKPPVLLSR